MISFQWHEMSIVLGARRSKDHPAGLASWNFTELLESLWPEMPPSECFCGYLNLAGSSLHFTVAVFGLGAKGPNSKTMDIPIEDGQAWNFSHLMSFV